MRRRAVGQLVAQRRERLRDPGRAAALPGIEQVELDRPPQRRDEQLPGRFGAVVVALERRVSERRAQAPQLDRIHSRATEGVDDGVGVPRVEVCRREIDHPQQVAHRRRRGERAGGPRRRGGHLPCGQLVFERRHLTRIVGDDRALLPRNGIVHVLDGAHRGSDHQRDLVARVTSRIGAVGVVAHRRRPA
ncbi:MAG: hypothetical protein EOO67_11180, partial [Microbacterium sp.]